MRRAPAQRAGKSRTGRPALAVLTRVGITVIGGYAASAGFVAALAVVLPLTGMARSEAVVFSSMLGFVVYAVLLLWGFAEHRLWRFCIALAVCVGGGLAASMGAAG